MRILKTPQLSSRELVSDKLRADYVYMYPPRQAYRPLENEVMAEAAAQSLRRPGPLNLYVHVPFCRQICAYCNLYAVGGVREHEHARYVEALRRELEHYAEQIGDRETVTIYIGGGTPSLLAPALLGDVLRDIRSLGLGNFESITEVALEVAPDTATPERLAGFAEAGINRINLGVQSWDDQELRLVGRPHGAEVPMSAIRAALATGFSNVCVDLIYGLQGQTDESWRRSVEALVDLRPETICCYPLTLRAFTGFDKRGYTAVSSESIYTRYDLANHILLSAGYVQETHVRWVIPSRGGYKQKANHWAGQDVLGVGAGARSYLHDADLRNGYSVRRRATTLKHYYQAIHLDGHARTDGFVMDEDERARKALILGLGQLSRAVFKDSYDIDPIEMFPSEFEQLEATGAVEVTDDEIALTSLGRRHRDVLVQMFFSERVRALVEHHSYDE